MRQIKSRAQSQQDVDIGKSHIRVHHHDPFAALRQRYRQIDRNIAFTNATLAAGDRYHSYRVMRFHLSYTLRLIHS